MNHNPYSIGEGFNTSATGLHGPEFESSVRTMQIISTALMMGVLTFLGIVLVTTNGNIDGKPKVLTLIAAGFAALMIANHFVIPGIMARAQLQQTAVGWTEKSDSQRRSEVCRVYQSQMIVGIALLEGAAFFNLIAMMVEHCIASIGVVTLLLSLMLVKFPTRDKVSFWVEDKLRELQLR